MTFAPPNTNYGTIYGSFTLPDNVQEWRTIIVDRELQTENAVNVKQNGQYQTEEFPAGQQWFSSNVQGPRSSFRKVINFGALPNTAAKSVAHGMSVNSAFTITRLEAYASDTTGFNYIPIPFAAAANQISLTMDATNVTITTTSNRTNFNVCYVVIEFLRN